VDRDIKINKSLGKTKDQPKARQGANLKELCGEITKLFSGHTKKKVDPDLKDCLIAMNTNYLVVTWKDNRSEELIPFRKYLLETLGSYNKAWELFTSPKTVYKNTCVANLANMFAETTAAIIKSQQEAKDQVKDNQAGITNAKTTKKPAKSGKSTHDRSAEETLKKFIQTYNTGAKLRKLADDVVHGLDVGGSAGESEADGALGIMEIEHIYKSAEFQKTHKKNKDMLAFRDWVHAHPSYKQMENFWADLTEGEAIDLEDFMRVCRPKEWQYIKDFLVYIGSSDKNPSDHHCEQVAKHLFKTLDAQKKHECEPE
jgi:hypothetical protein